MKHLGTVELVTATYTPIERGTITRTAEFAERLVELDIPAFIITQAGPTLERAIKHTNIGGIFKKLGYIGTPRGSVDFGTNAHAILPADRTRVAMPVGDEWAENGVTPLHSDLCTDGHGQQFSVNLTSTGASEFRLHENRLPEDLLDDQWDLLDPQVGSLLWYGQANPELISPEGFITELGEQDMLVFDPSYAHMVRGLTLPRRADAVFFERADEL